MKCTIKQLEVGKQYYLIETNRDKTEDILIFPAKMTDTNGDDDTASNIVVNFDVEVEDKTYPIFLVVPQMNKFAGDMTKKKLTGPNFYHEDEKTDTDLFDYNRAYILSDSIPNAIGELEEFLNKSYEQGMENVKNLLKEGKQRDSIVLKTELRLLKKDYDKQVKWLKTKYEI